MPEPTPHHAPPVSSTPSNDPNAPTFPDRPVAGAGERTATPAHPLAPDFDRELCELVADTAPAVFAVCEQDGQGTEFPDGWVVAWGLTREDGVTYAVGAGVGPEGNRAMTLTSPQRALWWFGGWRGADVRLVWLRAAPGATYDAPVVRAA
jgi:hypothetical protein